MSCKDFFEEELQWKMLFFEHEENSDFFLSTCQSSESPWPLMILRPCLFVAAIVITLYSKIYYMIEGQYGWWFIYLTHWGLMLVIFTTALSVIVSLKATIGHGGIGGENDGIAWYVKVYWLLYNIAKPLTILITSLYWILLFKCGDNVPLALCGHGSSMAIMMILLFTSRQPSHLLHFYQPFLFTVTWAIFSIIYYFAGGTNTEGKHYVYYVIDWSKPLPALGMIAIAAFALVLFHGIVVSLAVLRNWIRKKGDGTTFPNIVETSSITTI